MISPIKTTIVNQYNNATTGTAWSFTSLFFVIALIAFFSYNLRKKNENIFFSLSRGFLFTLIPVFVLFAYIILAQLYITIGYVHTDYDGIIGVLEIAMYKGGFITVCIVSFLLMLFVYREIKK